MKKYLLILLSLFSVGCHSQQTKQEIIDYCTNKYQKIAGNTVVLYCIKQEIDAQNTITKFENQQ
jgi:hypothetical protein